ncbi:putative ribosomal protein S6 kinase alpha-1 [Haliotis rubra]|uniref:putative ribosomal protein S6 kinase alpha-1 n=1 Tax=Haliotis rubra TaxID=36100 RepID=UPI001EE55B5C|nr:putative ribosomal protein S6 kinase alpha-1 [Haliotis rubra]
MDSDPRHAEDVHNAAAELWRKYLFKGRLVEPVSSPTSPVDVPSFPRHQCHLADWQFPLQSSNGILRSLPQDPFLGLTIRGYLFRGVINSGGSATIYNVFKDGKVFAAKVSHPRNTNPSEPSKLWANEFNMLNQLQHNNIIRAYEIFEHKGRQVLILEYVGGCNLAEFMTRRGVAGTQRAIKKIMKQVLEVLQYLHKHNVAHRDITPSHILIGQSGKVKIINFGDATRLGTNSSYLNRETEEHYPQNESTNVQDDIIKSFDIWKFGASIYETLSGKTPHFMRPNHSKLDVSAIHRADKQLMSLMKKCLDVNPLSRITAKLALKHDYFKRFFNYPRHAEDVHNAAAELWRKYLFKGRLVEPVSSPTPPVDVPSFPRHQCHLADWQFPLQSSNGILRSLPQDPFLGLTIRGYLFRGVINSGGSATIYNVFKDGKVFAAKVSHPRNTNPSEPSKLWANELNMLNQLQHNNIIRAYEIFEHKGRQVLILEYVGGCNLAEFMTRRGVAGSQRAIKKIMKQVLEVLQYLHKHNVAHRDITPSHILIGQSGKVKIINFGHATRLGTNSSYLNRETEEHYPQNESTNVQDDIIKSFDIWKFGASIYETLSGKTPHFMRPNHSKLDVSAIHRADKQLMSLMKKCLDVNPLSRITAKLALKHVYFKRFFN